MPPRTSITADAIAAASPATAAELAAAIDARGLADPALVTAVVRALAARGLFDAAFALVGRHVKAWRGSPALEVLAEALRASLASGADAHLEQALALYERSLRRDPSDLYGLGTTHADACECAARLGDPERGLVAIERLLDHYAPGRVGRDLPDDFPIDDPRVAELWRRPAQRTLQRALAAERARRARPARRR